MRYIIILILCTSMLCTYDIPTQIRSIQNKSRELLQKYPDVEAIATTNNIVSLISYKYHRGDLYKNNKQQWVPTILNNAQDVLNSIESKQSQYEQFRRKFAMLKAYNQYIKPLGNA